MTHEAFERRCVATSFDVRSEGNRHVFEGYALKWNARSQNLGGFVEEVAQGATTKTIREGDIRALFNHDPNMILGRSVKGEGTLRLGEDSTGLVYEVDMPDTSYARDLRVSMERGDVTQSSFGFNTVSGKESWTRSEGELPLRTLNEIRLFDVSPVTYPAYVDSTSGVSQRSLQAFAEFMESLKEPDPDEGTTPSALVPVRAYLADDLEARAILL
jgi:uncharacterized protein